MTPRTKTPTARDRAVAGRHPQRGIGAVLIAVYAVMAIGSTGRSAVQIMRDFTEAPLAYALSAAAALVYIVATVALALSGRVARTVAALAIAFEALGVLVVGTLSVTHPDLFAHPSVWSGFGAGYLFVPLVLPVCGFAWLATRRRREARTGDEYTTNVVEQGAEPGSAPQRTEAIL